MTTAYELKIEPTSTIYEIGVGPVDTCRARSLWETNKCILFEPLPSYYTEIAQAASSYPNVTVHNIAIHDHEGQCNFIKNGQASYIQGLNSPHVQFGSNGGQPASCRCEKISKFDQGDIDLLLLDMEGAEWFALKHLISRPTKIVVETAGYVFVTHDDHRPSKTVHYRNPFLAEIENWMRENNYKQTWQIGNDSIWERKI